MVRLHLRMNEFRQLSLVVLKDIDYLTVVFEVAAQMFHHLSGQIIEQVGVIVVGDIVKID